MLIRILKSFTKKTTTAPLGRWNTIVKEKEPEIHVKKCYRKKCILGES